MTALMKRRMLVGTSLGFIALFLYTYHLDSPSTQYFDEIYNVKTARSLVGLGPRYWTTHPMLGKVVIASGIRLFGDHPWSWRIFPALTGVAILFVLYGLTLTLTRSRSWSVCAAALFMMAGMSIPNARIAMLNSTMLLWMLLAVWAFCQYVVARSWSRRRALLCCGLSCGLALSTKWVALMTWELLALCLLVMFKDAPDRRTLAWETLAALLLVPLVIYTIVETALWLGGDHGWVALWRHQTYMLSYHTSLTATHPYGSRWIGWPLLLRPIWYAFQQEGDRVTGILCIGNPAIFWIIPPAIGYLIWQYVKDPTWTHRVIVAGFFTHWISYAVLSRVQFFYYFETALPFAILAITLLLKRLWESGRGGRAAVTGYLSLVVGLFIFWYPLLIGLPISHAYYQAHLWFRSWI